MPLLPPQPTQPGTAAPSPRSAWEWVCPPRLCRVRGAGRHLPSPQPASLPPQVLRAVAQVSPLPSGDPSTTSNGSALVPSLSARPGRPLLGRLVFPALPHLRQSRNWGGGGRTIPFLSKSLKVPLTYLDSLDLSFPVCRVSEPRAAQAPLPGQEEAPLPALLSGVPWPSPRPWDGCHLSPRLCWIGSFARLASPSRDENTGRRGAQANMSLSGSLDEGKAGAGLGPPLYPQAAWFPSDPAGAREGAQHGVGAEDTRTEMNLPQPWCRRHT